MPCSAPPHGGSPALKTQPSRRTLDLVPPQLLEARCSASRHRLAVSSATAGREGDSQPALSLKANYRRWAPRPWRDV